MALDPAPDPTWPDPVVIIGEDSVEVAAAAVREGGPPGALEGDRFSLLTAGEIPAMVSVPGDLPSGWASLVVLRSAWVGRAEVATSLRWAARVLRPGGTMMASEVHVDRLSAGSPLRYPTALTFRFSAAASAQVVASAVRPSDLTTEAIRAGFKDVSGMELDEERGRYVSAAAYVAAVESHRARLLIRLTDGEHDKMVGFLADEMRRAVPLGEVVDREPWFVVTGRRP